MRVFRHGIVLPFRHQTFLNSVTAWLLTVWHLTGLHWLILDQKILHDLVSFVSLFWIKHPGWTNIFSARASACHKKTAEIVSSTGRRDFTRRREFWRAFIFLEWEAICARATLVTRAIGDNKMKSGLALWWDSNDKGEWARETDFLLLRVVMKMVKNWRGGKVTDPGSTLKAMGNCGLGPDKNGWCTCVDGTSGAIGIRPKRLDRRRQ